MIILASMSVWTVALWIIVLFVAMVVAHILFDIFTGK